MGVGGSKWEKGTDCSKLRTEGDANASARQKRNRNNSKGTRAIPQRCSLFRSAKNDLPRGDEYQRSPKINWQYPIGSTLRGAKIQRSNDYCLSRGTESLLPALWEQRSSRFGRARDGGSRGDERNEPGRAQVKETDELDIAAVHLDGFRSGRALTEVT